jgi:hypothetical protein
MLTLLDPITGKLLCSRRCTAAILPNLHVDRQQGLNRRALADADAPQIRLPAGSLC